VNHRTDPPTRTTKVIPLRPDRRPARRPRSNLGRRRREARQVVRGRTRRARADGRRSGVRRPAAGPRHRRAADHPRPPARPEGGRGEREAGRRPWRTHRRLPRRPRAGRVRPEGRVLVACRAAEAGPPSDGVVVGSGVVQPAPGSGQQQRRAHVPHPRQGNAGEAVVPWVGARRRAGRARDRRDRPAQDAARVGGMAARRRPGAHARPVRPPRGEGRSSAGPSSRPGSAS
jgi:hypothetical protein